MFLLKNLCLTLYLEAYIKFYSGVEELLKHWHNSFLIPFFGSASFPKLSNLFSLGKTMLKSMKMLKVIAYKGKKKKSEYRNI